MELQEKLAGIRKRGLGLAAISYDSPAILKSFAGRKNITFPLLSDPDSKVIKAYGVFSEGVPTHTPAALGDRFKPGGQWYGVPYPGTFMVNAAGVVTAKYFEEDYRERYTASDILVHEYGADGSAHETVETKHLTVSTSASATSVKMGQRVALVMEVRLKPRMHVYAPGVQGYTPIEWSLADSPAIKVHDLSYPASKKLHLKAIDETVPVYQNQLRLVREINIGPDAAVKQRLNEKGELKIEGEFRYQACDDRTCYFPQAVPVAWTLAYESLDGQRAPSALQRQGPPR